MEEGDLFGDWQVREHVHPSDPNDTSAEAAELARRVAGPQALMVFDFLKARPMTQDELRELTGLGDNAAKRCSDLKNSGWIIDSGARGLSNKGNSAVLWAPTDYGRKRRKEIGVVVKL